MGLLLESYLDFLFEQQTAAKPELDAFGELILKAAEEPGGEDDPFGPATKKLASDGALQTAVQKAAYVAFKGKGQDVIDDEVADFFLKDFRKIIRIAADGLKAGNFSPANLSGLILTNMRYGKKDKRKKDADAIGRGAFTGGGEGDETFEKRASGKNSGTEMYQGAEGKVVRKEVKKAYADALKEVIAEFPEKDAQKLIGALFTQGMTTKKKGRSADRKDMEVADNEREGLLAAIKKSGFDRGPGQATIQAATKIAKFAKEAMRTNKRLRDAIGAEVNEGKILATVLQTLLEDDPNAPGVAVIFDQWLASALED